MRLFLVTLIVAALSLLASASVPYKYCDEQVKTLVHDLDIEINEGSNREISPKVTGTLTREIVSGSFRVEISFDGFPLIKKSGDLCKLHSCPIPAGKV